MKMSFSDSFFNSLDKLHRYEAWHNRMWRAITGDFWQFLKNIWRFREELWMHRWWDYRFTLEMLRKSLVIMEKGMHDGMEVHETRSKKIEKMQRAIAILNNIIDDSYVKMAEDELGEIIYRDWEFEDVRIDLDIRDLLITKRQKKKNTTVKSLPEVEKSKRWSGKNFGKSCRVKTMINLIKKKTGINSLMEVDLEVGGIKK
jgi:hypothetical protein